MGPADGEKLRIRLDGSGEEVEAHHTSVHRMKRK
jgi:hypothetical protein